MYKIYTIEAIIIINNNSVRQKKVKGEKVISKIPLSPPLEKGDYRGILICFYVKWTTYSLRNCRVRVIKGGN